MENKYYTPDEEDFYVGMIYETLEDEVLNRWESNEIKNLYDLEDSCKYNKNYIGKYSDIRVKYLDREDIESLGWKESISNNLKNYKIITSVYRWALYYNENIRKVTIIMESEGWLPRNGCLFDGIINNKSELKKLMKQLNISKRK